MCLTVLVELQLRSSNSQFITSCRFNEPSQISIAKILIPMSTRLRGISLLLHQFHETELSDSALLRCSHSKLVFRAVVLARLQNTEHLEGSFSSRTHNVDVSVTTPTPSQNIHRKGATAKRRTRTCCNTHHSVPRSDRAPLHPHPSLPTSFKFTCVNITTTTVVSK